MNLFEMLISARFALFFSGSFCAAAMLAAQPAVQPVERPWPLAGRQGIIQVVIVPLDQARDREAYKQQIGRLCTAGQTCFVNFFTNSTDAPLTVPLPDAIASEATALYRHSMKQGAELFRWSCRLGLDPADCF